MGSRLPDSNGCNNEAPRAAKHFAYELNFQQSTLTIIQPDAADPSATLVVFFVKAVPPGVIPFLCSEPPGWH